MVNYFIQLICLFLDCTGTLQVHPQAEQYKKKFKKLKGQLAEKLFRIFNEDIFDSKVNACFFSFVQTCNFFSFTNLVFQLPTDLKIEWSNRMRRTAGFCYQRRIKTCIGPNNECLRSARIVLSSKVCQ